MKQKGISTEVLKDFRIKGKWKVIAVLKVTFPKFHMNSQQGHLFLNFISQRNWFLVRVCGFVCCHVWSEPQRNHSEPLRLSRGSIQPSTPTLNNSYSSTAASMVGRVQGQFLHAFKNATEKKRKDKSLLPLWWSSWCYWCPILPHKLGFFWVFSRMSPTEEQVCVFRKYFYCQSLGNLWGNLKRVFIYKINSSRPDIEFGELHIRPSVVRT